MTDSRLASIRTAVVGTGYAVRVAAPLYRSHAAFTLTAVVGRKPDRARTLLGAANLPPELACTMSELIRCDDVSLVHMASPNACHEEQIRQLIEHPATLLLEKPLSLDNNRQQKLGEALLRRTNPSFVNLPLRAMGMPGLAVPAGDNVRATVQLSSPFNRRYDDVDTWKTVEAQGGGARHILLPHLCDYVLQLVRRFGDRLDRIDLTMDPAAAGTSERLDVSLLGAGPPAVMNSMLAHSLPHEDTFQRLFERSLDPLAEAIVGGVNETRPGTTDTMPLAEVEDLLLAYRLISVLEEHPSRSRTRPLAWCLDSSDIAEVSAWITPNERSTEKQLEASGFSHE